MFNDFQALENAHLDADLAAAVMNDEIGLDWAISFQNTHRRPYLAHA